MQRQNPTSKTNIGVGCHAVSVTMLGMVGPPGGGSGVSWSRGMQWAMAKAPITITPGASYLIRDHIPNLTLILACVLCAGIWWESIGDWGGGGGGWEKEETERGIRASRASVNIETKANKEQKGKICLKIYKSPIIHRSTTDVQRITFTYRRCLQL